MHVVKSQGEEVAAFADYTVAVLCLPALARAIGHAVVMHVSVAAKLTVVLPRGVFVSEKEEEGTDYLILVCRP